MRRSLFVGITHYCKHQMPIPVYLRNPRLLDDVEYAIEANIVRDKKKVNVRFQVVKDSRIAAMFGIRMIRTDVER